VSLKNRLDKLERQQGINDCCPACHLPLGEVRIAEISLPCSPSTPPDVELPQPEHDLCPTCRQPRTPVFSSFRPDRDGTRRT
jgi:hypothetical protein